MSFSTEIVILQNLYNICFTSCVCMLRLFSLAVNDYVIVLKGFLHLG